MLSPQPLLFACVSGCFGPVIPQIADRDDIGEFYVEAALHMRHSPVEADDSALPPGSPPPEAPVADWVDQQRDVPLDDDGPHETG